MLIVVSTVLMNGFAIGSKKTIKTSFNYKVQQAARIKLNMCHFTPLLPADKFTAQPTLYPVKLGRARCSYKFANIMEIKASFQ